MKAGVKTTEFVLSTLAEILGGAMATGLIPSEGPWLKIVGLVVAGLAALGYTAARARVKAKAK
jgi:hypothetical protein